MGKRNYRVAPWVALALSLCACASGGKNMDNVLRKSATAWVGTWNCSLYLTEPANMPTMKLSGATLRQVLRVSIPGKTMRVLISNRLGATALEIRSARIAETVRTQKSAIKGGTSARLTFGGLEGVTIPAGASVYSDPLKYDLKPLSEMAISLYLGSVPQAVTGHPGSRTTSYIKAGDAVEELTLSNASEVDHWYLIGGIDVENDGKLSSIVCLGDSITDGRGTTTNAQNRWTDGLATRLQADPARAKYAVLNEGIGGTLVMFSGVERFDRDVLSQPGARYVIMLYGINDIIYANASAERVIATYKNLIAQARAKGLTSYGGTILPFGKCNDFSAAREKERQAVNQWIRSALPSDGGFDACIDFDEALRDITNPTAMADAYNCGDGLHPGPAGYQKMAEIIDLGLF
jgi:lysophospholipase L1-like esterase